MDRQQIFNTAYLGMASQGFLRSVGGDSCMYRGLYNRKCALGHCISDDAYNPKLERETVSNPDVIAAIGIPNLTEDDLQFLDVLQKCHDLGEGPREVRESFEEFATHNGLTIPDSPYHPTIAALRGTLERLLGCPALNLDDLEDEDRDAIKEAQEVLNGY